MPIENADRVGEAGDIQTPIGETQAPEPGGSPGARDDTGEPSAAAKGNAGGGANGDRAVPVTVNKWQFMSLLAVLVVLVIVLVAAFIAKGNNDTVTGIVGAVLPSFVSLGAAVFGVKLAYDAGKSTGEESGKTKGEANKDEAVKDGQDKAARAIAKRLKAPGHDDVGQLVSHLRREGHSPAGQAGFQLAADHPNIIELPDALLTQAERTPANVETALAVAEEYMRK